MTTAGEKNSVSLSYTLHENAFMKGFLRNIYLRPSCYACPTKGGKSGSDITLADYWGIQHLMPEFDDDRGVSALTINTEKGQMAMRAIGAEIHSAPYEDLCTKNTSLLHSCSIPANRSRFFATGTKGFHQRIDDISRVPLKQRIKAKVYNLANKCLNKQTKQLIKKVLGR